jgi:putative heme iron utilization protein
MVEAMDPTASQALQQLIVRADVAALGTLHKDEPFVSMVPYALLPPGVFVIHVSRLATHTRDMLDHPGVSLMVLGERDAAMPAQAVPRASLQGDARPCLPEDPLYAGARAAYLARFPDTEFMFGFADFSLFIVTVRAVRFVAGFAQATSVPGDAYASLMRSNAAQR